MTSNPETELKCECPERLVDMARYGIHICGGGKRRAPEDFRPTPEIGEDELVERLRGMLFTGSDEAALRDHNTTREAANRLCLYREARERAEQIISAWAFAHDIDGAARNDLFARLRLTALSRSGGA